MSPAISAESAATPRPITVPALGQWNGWASLAETAELEVDADGYLYGDGRRLNDRHSTQIHYLRAALRNHFRDRPEVVVYTDMFLHFQLGDTSKFLGPDVLVTVGGVLDPNLSSQKAWQRGLPSFVMEVLSDSTRGRDLGLKRDVYEALGIQEYWLHDPWGSWMPERLRRESLSGGIYESERLQDKGAPDSSRFLVSEVLGLELGIDAAGDLRLRDPATGEHLLSPAELHAERLFQTERAESEARRADKAEARLAELEKLLALDRQRPPPE